MAREYPKFLFQHVTTGKSIGRFIVHLLKPRCIYKIIEQGDESKLKLIECFDDADEKDLRNEAKRAFDWYFETQRKVDDVVDLFPTGLSLKDAYRSLFNERGIYKTLELSRSRISNTKKFMESGIFPTDTLMKSHLEKCGWKKVSTELWSKISIK